MTEPWALCWLLAVGQKMFVTQKNFHSRDFFPARSTVSRIYFSEPAPCPMIIGHIPRTMGLHGPSWTLKECPWLAGHGDSPHTAQGYGTHSHVPGIQVHGNVDWAGKKSPE
jgi:hypothetical protein